MKTRTLALLVLAGASSAFAQSKLPIERIKVPPGFEVTVFAEGVDNARSMALGEKGTLFVGSMGSGGNVYAIKHDGKKATQVTTIAKGLDTPNGVAVKDGALYVAEISKIWRYDNIESTLGAAKPTLVYGKYPTDKHHGWKFIRFGPDGWLYVPVGAPCNICDREPPYASITRLKPDGSAMEVYARGVRNSVGFDWHPETRELWFTDNGRDMMGDDVPDDELDHAPKAGMHFGYPYCHAGDVADPEFGARRKCAEFTPPAQKLGAHVASLGMRFYTGSMFPAEYRDRIFIAEHGSWNRSKKSGYRVVAVKVEGGKAVEHTVFAEGFLDAAGDKAWGRPVDVQVMPDGALLVSDDTAGAIYRIALKGR
jgi:glucose/arabinose dehydrogenase